MDYYYDRKPFTTGFFEPVETNGIKLCDEYFVQINQDSLDLISKILHMVHAIAEKEQQYLKLFQKEKENSKL